MVHTNFIPIGRKLADFPGGIIPNHSVNGASEWAYGVADWFELRLYLPVCSLYSTGRVLAPIALDIIAMPVHAGSGLAILSPHSANPQVRPVGSKKTDEGALTAVFLLLFDWRQHPLMMSVKIGLGRQA
jgi:hypothetical protein